MRPAALTYLIPTLLPLRAPPTRNLQQFPSHLQDFQLIFHQAAGPQITKQTESIPPQVPEGQASNLTKPGSRLGCGALFSDDNLYVWQNRRTQLSDLYRFNFTSNQWAYHGQKTLAFRFLPACVNGPDRIDIYSSRTPLRAASDEYSGHVALVSGAVTDDTRQNLVGNTRNYQSVGVHEMSNERGKVGYTDGFSYKGGLWFFGGLDCNSIQGMTCVSLGFQNADVWRYSLTLNAWAAMQIHPYNSQPYNSPQARIQAKFVQCGAGDTAYLFGGRRDDDALDDLWRYDMPVGLEALGDTWSAGNWTFLGGELQSQVDPAATAGYTKRQPDDSYWPGRRQWHQMVCYQQPHDLRYELYVYGGGVAAPSLSTVVQDATYGDLWRYDLLQNVWTWVAGEAFQWPPYNGGNYITPAYNNLPLPRALPVMVVWNDSIVVGFGSAQYSVGSTADFLSDLWRWPIDVIPPPPVSSTGSSSSSSSNSGSSTGIAISSSTGTSGGSSSSTGTSGGSSSSTGTSGGSSSSSSSTGMEDSPRGGDSSILMFIIVGIGVVVVGGGYFIHRRSKKGGGKGILSLGALDKHRRSSGDEDEDYGYRRDSISSSTSSSFSEISTTSTQYSDASVETSTAAIETSTA